MSDEVRRELAQLRRDLETVARHVQPPSREDTGSAVRDQMWKCESCGSLLGFYDTDHDLMRVKYKDFVSFARAGGVSPGAVAAALLSASEICAVPLDAEAIEQFTQRVCEVADFGFLQVVCRGCAKVNTAGYAPVEDGRHGDG